MPFEGWLSVLARYKQPKPSYLISVYLLNEVAAFQWHTLLLIRLKAGSVISLFYNISHHFSPALPPLVTAGVLAESWVYYLYQLLLLCLVPALCDLGAFSLIFHSLTAEYLHSLQQTWRPQDENFICSTNCALLTISDLPSSVFVWQRDGKREERCYLSIVWPRCVYKDGCLYVDIHTHTHTRHCLKALLTSQVIFSISKHTSFLYKVLILFYLHTITE